MIRRGSVVGGVGSVVVMAFLAVANFVESVVFEYPGLISRARLDL